MESKRPLLLIMMMMMIMMMMIMMMRMMVMMDHDDDDDEDDDLLPRVLSQQIERSKVTRFIFFSFQLDVFLSESEERNAL